ncbi:MAG: hypothetical protein WC455_26025 [Dehalococcoidia bacterium]|jgi:DNA-binding MarR family transcriptional regulator
MTRRKSAQDVLDEYRNNGQIGKWFTSMLNMADDDLDPFEYRLLAHYVRVCGANNNGQCFQNIRTISKITRMSIPKITSTRNTLAEKGWISVRKRSNDSVLVIVIDRMLENIQRYSDKNIDHDKTSDQYFDHDDQNIDLGDQYPAIKEEPIKKNQKEKPKDIPPTSGQKAVQSHIALIDAYWAALPGGKPYGASYSRFARKATIAVGNGATPEQVNGCTRALYDPASPMYETRNAKRIVTFDEVLEKITLWQQKTAPPPPPVTIDLGTEADERARRKAMLQRHQAHYEAGDYNELLGEMS